MPKKPSRTPGRTSRTVLLSDSLIDRARNAVYWTRMLPGEPASFAALAEAAIGKEVDRLEGAYNDGEPFPHGELRPGPAPGVMERVAAEKRARAAQENAGGAAQREPADAPSAEVERRSQRDEADGHSGGGDDV